MSERAPLPGPEPGADDAGRHVWSVSGIVQAARELVEGGFSRVFVRGELSDFHAHSSGHWYFALKDDDAVLEAAMFRRENRDVPFDVSEGMELIVGGRLTIYPRRGRFQLVADLMEPVGWGALQLAYEQLVERLGEEGLFAPERKRPLPALPRCVGVVTSKSGAAWHDILRVWQRNRVPVRALLAPARVQGPGAADEIVAAIERLTRHAAADVLIVGRGGGSREDLWAFNEEKVARAVAGSGIPVISAVGHEVDQTIADLAADHRAATPTAAAEIVAASRERLVARLREATRTAANGIGRRTTRARARLHDPALQRRLRQPASLLNVYRQRLDDTFDRIDRPFGRIAVDRAERLRAARERLVRSAPAEQLLRRSHRLADAARNARNAILRLHREGRSAAERVAGRVHALSPLGVLKRGYSICELDDGTVVLGHDDVDPGDALRVRLGRGELDCTVDATRPPAGSDPTPPADG